MLPRRRLSSILDAMLTPLHAPKEQHKIVCVYFHHNGISVSPGRQRVYAKLIMALWSLFGPVADVHYEQQFRYCVITYESFLDATNAMEFLNETHELIGVLNTIIATYSDAQDRDMASRIIEELFVPSASGGAIVHAMGCSTCHALDSDNKL